MQICYVKDIKKIENIDRKKHWKNLYQTKDLKDVSWYQPIPKTSLDFLKQFNIPSNANSLVFDDALKTLPSLGGKKLIS